MPKQPPGPVVVHVASKSSQHAPIGHGLDEHICPDMNVPPHSEAVVTEHDPSASSQHAPVHGFGVQASPDK